MAFEKAKQIIAAAAIGRPILAFQLQGKKGDLKVLVVVQNSL